MSESRYLSPRHTTTRSRVARHLRAATVASIPAAGSARRRYAAGAAVAAMLFGSVAVLVTPADASFTSAAPLSTTIGRLSVPSLHTAVVHRVGRVAGTSTHIRGRGSRPTSSARIGVTVRVLISSTARATATVSDGVDAATEVRTVQVSRTVSRTSFTVTHRGRAAARARARAAAWVAALQGADVAATQTAADTALAAARVTYTRRHTSQPSPSGSASASASASASLAPTTSPTPVVVTPSPTTSDSVSPSATTSVSPTATATSVPAPIVTPTVDPNAMPVGNLTGWKQVFADDFTKTAALGSFLSTYGSTWSAYPSPWKDTSRNGTYNPAKTLSTANGLLDIFVHTENGVHYVSAPEPRLPTMTYGRYSVRFQSDSTPGYKAAWLLWPDSGVWPGDGEIDFPEGDLDSNMSAFAHFASGNGGQDAFTLAATFASWHTATVEWTPGKVVFYLDGRVVGTCTKMVPSKPMHWVLQTETTLSGAVPSDSASGHVRIDWVTAYTYAP